MNGVAFITTNDGAQADAELVLRFRQALTERERTAVFADVVRQHGGAVLGSCAQWLWPDADAAVAAARGVLIAARLAMADSAKLTHPDRLRDWLLGIAGCGGLTSGPSATIDDINWAAVQAHDARDTPEMPDSLAIGPSLRPWLQQIVATLPEARQRLYDLFVARSLDSRSAARQLGTDLAGVRRLRSENRQAILRAFEITALVAAETDPDPFGSRAPGCQELQQILADTQRDGDAHPGARRHPVVLPAALRLTVTRHVSQCATCQDQRDDRTARWAPELLPILACAELPTRSWRTCSRLRSRLALGSIDVPAPQPLPAPVLPGLAPPGGSSHGLSPRRRGPDCWPRCCCSGSCGQGSCMARRRSCRRVRPARCRRTRAPAV